MYVKYCVFQNRPSFVTPYLKNSQGEAYSLLTKQKSSWGVKMRLVSIELDQKLLELIDSIAWNEGRSRSSFVRYIIMKELSTIQVPEEKSQKVLEWVTLRFRSFLELLSDQH